MLGEQLISIQEPDNNADWFILHTDSASYDLKLGGIMKTSSKSTGPFIKLPFDKAIITRALTDNFTIYIELENNYCIVHSDTFINADGLTSFEVYIHDKDLYKNDGGLEGMSPIKYYD
jgi:hypothetical protein